MIISATKKALIRLIWQALTIVVTIAPISAIAVNERYFVNMGQPWGLPTGPLESLYYYNTFYPEYKNIGPYNSLQEACTAAGDAQGPYLRILPSWWMEDQAYNGSRASIPAEPQPSHFAVDSTSLESGLRCFIKFKTNENYSLSQWAIDTINKGHPLTPYYTVSFNLVLSCEYGYSIDSTGLACVNDNIPPNCENGANGFYPCPPNAPINTTPTSPLQNIGDPRGTPGIGPADGLLGVNQNASSNDADSQTCKLVEEAGDPIIASTGSVFLKEQDFTSPVGMNFIRYYHSAHGAWFHNYGQKIISNSLYTTANVVRSDGRILTFTKDSNDNWSSNSTVIEKLVRLSSPAPDGSIWQITNANDDLEGYDNRGRLIFIKSPNGKFISYTYGAYELLISVRNNYGIGFDLNYSNNAPTRGWLNYAKSTGGWYSLFSYELDTKRFNASYPYNGSAKYYKYENSKFPYLLTSVLDEYNNLYQSWTYDDSGRAITATQPGGANTAAVSYTTDASGTSIVSAKITSALGSSRTLNFQNVQGRVLFSGQDTPCVGCVGNASSKTIDPASGLTTQTTDFNGNAKVVAYDYTRNLPTQIVEASGQAIERKTTIQWHPTYRVPVQVAGPKKTTNYVYDANRNLLSRSEVDNATSIERKWSWTYDSFGNPLTQTDPRGNTTQYTYNSLGLVATETNPLGQVTKYDNYDADGFLLHKVDANGVESSYTYTDRRKVATITVAGQKTTFTYDLRGLLTGITFPDNNSVTLQYDLAQRLTGIVDISGNKIAYTLNGEGGRVAETISTSSNVLIRQVNRAFSDLGLLQRTTGGE